MPQQFANAPTTAPTGSITNVATSFTVASATGFPTTAPFRINVSEGSTHEIMEVTAGAGTATWTVARAVESVQGSSTAQAFTTAASVDHVLTANSLSVAIYDRQPFRDFKYIFGQTLKRGHIPHAAQLTKRAIAGDFNWPTAISTLAEARTSLATLYPSGFAVAGLQYRIPAGIYREAIPSATADGVRLYAYGDVAITTFDRWDIGTNIWSAAAAPNAATSFVSSLNIPTITVDGDGPPINDATKALPEQCMVDGVMFNRVAAGSTLAAGQFMLDGSRHVVLRTGDGLITGHKIEVSMRSNICTPGSGGTNLVLDGLYLYGGPSGADTNQPISQNSQAGFTVKNCMIGFTHGLAIAAGGAVGFKAIDNVFHNVGSACIDSGSNGTLIAGNIAFNCGGSQNTYSNALDQSGYDYSWGSGFGKVAQADYGVYRDNICWNLGFNAYWFDIWCRYGSIVNNVAWDIRDTSIQYEVSNYYSIHGNHIFQTSSTQFAGAAIGAYIFSSRDGNLGPDLDAGQEPNVFMRIGTCVKLGWDVNRTDLPVGGGATGGNNAASGGFKRNRCHDNIMILRKTGGQGPGGPDLAIHWSDLINGAPGAAINDASNTGWHNLIGFENATDNVSGMTWPSDFIYLSDVTGMTGQSGGYLTNVADWIVGRWDTGTDTDSRTHKSRYLTYAEQAHYLNMYGLSQVS